MGEVGYTDEFEGWCNKFSPDQQEALHERATLLVESGPNLRRPVVGEVKGSRHKNMKESIVSAAGSLRVLFVSDPRRHAILLLGGDKTRDWEG